MAAPPALLIKAGLYAAENWKKLIPILAGCFMAMFVLPFSMFMFFLPTNDPIIEPEYKRIVSNSHLDWVELLAYDTVKNTNDFSKANPVISAMSFIIIDYTEYEYVPGTEESPGYWIPVRSESLTGYESILSFLNRNNYPSSIENLTISNIKNFCTQLDSTPNYDIKFTQLTILDLIDDWPEGEREWILDLLTVLYDQHGLFTSDPSNTREFYNPSNASMANIKLNPTAYRLGNVRLLTGDVDIDPIFAGRLAALCEDQNQDLLNITSGYRSIQEQQAIWNSTPPEKRGKYVAKPGKSRHQYGLAADISGWLLYLDNSVLVKYGLYKPMSYEDWHIEPIETRKKISPQSRSAGIQHFFFCQETVEYRSA